MGRAMRRILILMLLAWPAYAGYYGTVIARPSGTYYTVGSITGCYLTPSMALTSFNTGYPWTVYNVDTDASTISATNPVQYLNLTMRYDYCNAVPSVSALPIFLGSFSDPAITGGTVTGGSPSTGGTTSSTVDLVIPPIVPVSPEFAIEDSLSLFGLGMLFLSTIWAGRRIYDVFNSDLTP